MQKVNRLSEETSLIRRLKVLYSQTTTKIVSSHPFGRSNCDKTDEICRSLSLSLKEKRREERESPNQNFSY